MIKAPFNFVPLSEKVFFPDWADQISHDIPFEDGMSGTIKLKITAESPIFVRNGHTEDDQKNGTENYESFSKTPDGRFFIPATSIKGVIRSVLEIISCGKMMQMQNQSFGIRDLSNGADGKFYRGKIKTDRVHCGWLRYDSEKEQYWLTDCGLPWRISPSELDRKYNCGLDNFVKNDDFKKDENRTAMAKYKLFKGKRLINRFSSDEGLRKSLTVGARQFVKFDEEGKEGTIVFTGQPGARKQNGKMKKDGTRGWTGKYFEFVFPAARKAAFLVEKYVIREFLSVHQNSPDYVDKWKKELVGGKEIPVFFTYDNDKRVESMGLSYMYKYPAYNSIYNGVSEEFLDKERMDLAECIFGTVDSADGALKGRVAFSHAMAVDAPTELSQEERVLSTPHPSYYPLYLGDGQTWNSENIRLAGRKRYPVRDTLM
ncbi:MAG: TIGR03986 family CRISPR-associated RAMP protein, partial [Bacteroidaceae bacterium]|nr:TIGR03986 family CRISPR-associated RAMP protein [Bacteroidaceae bacterium]